MKPVAIMRHYCTEGPGYFATYLERCGLRWQLVRIDAGESVPPDALRFSGVAFMGGPMSVNDPLPWIAQATALIRQCVAADVPVIGHCLGGQLIARALGATITPNASKEIGWGEVEVEDVPQVLRWFGAGLRRFTTFHWHGETFSLPAGAVRLLSSPLCRNQAFAIGKHLALQCHVEMTAELIESWCRSGAQEIAHSAGPGVQPAEVIERDLAERLARLHAIADRVYARWVEGLRL
ncbi:MAG: type 1 glutamine amidotransferase [Burkholderiales bacterium]|nr:type 1 glutamine amidotransferase [Burkholderiales bacterium]